MFLVLDGPAADLAYAVLAATLRQRGRWGLGRMVLGGHRQVAVLRPASATLIVQVLHYPEQVRGCPLGPLLPGSTLNPFALVVPNTAIANQYPVVHPTS